MRGRINTPEGVSGAGGGGEILELGGHGLDEGNGETLLNKKRKRTQISINVVRIQIFPCALKLMTG